MENQQTVFSTQLIQKMMTIRKNILKSDSNLHDGDGRKYMKSPLVNPLVRPNLQYEFRGIKSPRSGWLYKKERMEEMYQNNEISNAK